MANREGQQLGNYRIIRKLGEGGFAEVYLGEHIHLNTKAAIKVQSAQLTGDDRELFLKEARTIANLDHPNIVRVLEFGIERDILFLVMSYASNGSLRDRHSRGAVLPITTVVSYVRQVADALQFAHDQKLIHRDIKPENMLVGTRNEVLLSDFGLSIVTRSTRTMNLEDKVIAGTPLYMAPEQFLNKPRPASDQYSLGVVVYEWLCGTPPFGGNFMQLAYQHREVLPPRLRDENPSVSLAIEQVVMTTLAKEPARRFASIRAFATALEQASQERPLPPQNFMPATPMPPVSPTPLPVATMSSTTMNDVATTDEIITGSTSEYTSTPTPILSLPKDAQLHLDTLPPPDLFNRILREIGKNARNAR